MSNKKSNSVLVCENCNLKLKSRSEMTAHLLDVHSIDAKSQTCLRQMISHVDMTDYYTDSYRYTFSNGVVIVEATVTMRDHDDLLSFKCDEEK